MNYYCVMYIALRTGKPLPLPLFNAMWMNCGGPPTSITGIFSPHLKGS